ncbi:S46 family peptidase [Carboxylicivirga linearis]|uniref:Dipeptidyl-peptidase n=1 Tax=Carboxylicivirga linearis TaxID=1628157 RepID=A0ABS5JUD5_9BACT|nr:S46 family peptidase [Carboxylicivirga linearis]MBS2098458.1 S46 family peptidase [Carboxylicivirga linearis]
MKRILLGLIGIALLIPQVKADEGMWIPMLLKKYNIEQMQEMGFKLTAEDIYSVNEACLKDAVVIFGRGCTGELISDQGLMITNHHCGYGQIQYHSTVDNDYLTNGFWAMSKEEELVNPDLTVTFLKRMEDVTEQVLEGVTDEMNNDAQSRQIQKNIIAIKKEAVKDTHYKAVLKPFFNGNQYFLFINEVFKDVRLVGAPPSAIGKFGGDTDNWMWPRHTGDFSVFRIYGDKDNQPAEYSKDNVPYRPKKHFSVSMKGVEEGDFTMVFGYPGSTYEYVPSYHLKMLTETVNPKLIDVRTEKLNILNRHQAADPKVRIQYAAKNARISNSWKRWIGENRGLVILDAINKKQQYENQFTQWAMANEVRAEKYGNLLSEYEELYEKYTPYRLAKDYIQEVVYRNGIEIISMASKLKRLASPYHLADQTGTEVNMKIVEKQRTKVKADAELFFKNYYKPIDKELCVKLLQMYQNDIPDQFKIDIENLNKKFKGDVAKYVDYLFKKSICDDEAEVMSFIDSFSEKSLKRLEKDPANQLFNSIMRVYSKKVLQMEQHLKEQLDQLNKTYMAAQMEFESDKVFYPDANFTLRVAYGKVAGYTARDAVEYEYYTTLDGIIEKDNPDIYDYRVPQKLKDLYAQKDYGRYEVDGTVPVCFIATNHTTGGNSGSPVLNADGHLIGVNFDRAWEGVMSDLMFNPDQCRNITLDIRYVLFLIDKFAGAGYLLDEMTIVE